MAVFAAFADDSGSHAQSPMMILAVVISEQESWKQFSDDWWSTLTAARPLRAVNGKVYFRSSDAEALTGCFEGFTREAADEKVELLTDIVLKYIGY